MISLAIMGVLIVNILQIIFSLYKDKEIYSRLEKVEALSIAAYKAHHENSLLTNKNNSCLKPE
jgi:hypothetical protein